MYPLKINEKYDQNNLDNLWYRFSVVYTWTYIKWDYKEWTWSHPWVDIVPVYPNQEVLAVLDWVVLNCWEDTAYWKYVFLKHTVWDEVYVSCYEHLSDFFVKVWDKVSEWDIIWKTGNTWLSYWEHLHFQIDREYAPFYWYWPYNGNEIEKLWIKFSEWVNLRLWKEKVLKYTVNPLVFLDNIKNDNNISSKNKKEAKKITENENKIEKESLVKKTQEEKEEKHEVLISNSKDNKDSNITKINKKEELEEKVSLDDEILVADISNKKIEDIILNEDEHLKKTI